MARKVDPKVKAALWHGVRNEFERPLGMFVNMGVNAKKGQTKKEAMIEVMTEVVKLAYETGLDRGYDMAAEVFDPEGGEQGEGGSPEDDDET